MLRTAGARVVESDFAAGRADRLFAVEGGLVDQAVQKQLAEVIAALVREARVHKRLAA